MTTAPLLEVRHLRVEFPTRRGTLVALDDISFDIAPGEILGVVGESGAGKSLTGAAIIGLLDPPGRVAGGEIHFDGRRAPSRGKAERSAAWRWTSHRNRGFSASRNQSPSRFTLSAISTSIRPGKIVIHHSPENRKSLPTRISVPSEGDVGGTQSVLREPRQIGEPLA